MVLEHTFLELIPEIITIAGGICGVIWYCIRFYEYYKSRKIKNGEL